MLTLQDLTGDVVQGKFRVNEVVLIDADSKYHPNNAHFKPTVTNVWKICIEPKKKKSYLISLAGKL